MPWITQGGEEHTFVKAEEINMGEWKITFDPTVYRPKIILRKPSCSVKMQYYKK